jgi:N-methylhydantoinase B
MTLWRVGVDVGGTFTDFAVLNAETGALLVEKVPTTPDNPAEGIVNGLENTFPVRVRRFELVRDSAGAGKFRGGLCYRREYELLRGATINRRADRTRFASDGVLGGKLGQLGRLVRNPGRPDEEALPGAGLYQMPAGATIRFEGSGAGGFGNPFDRDPDAVAQDAKVGYVSLEAAERDYGVVLDPTPLRVDLEATRARRAATS